MGTRTFSALTDELDKRLFNSNEPPRSELRPERFKQWVGNASQTLGTEERLARLLCEFLLLLNSADEEQIASLYGNMTRLDLTSLVAGMLTDVRPGRTSRKRAADSLDEHGGACAYDSVRQEWTMVPRRSKLGGSNGGNFFRWQPATDELEKARKAANQEVYRQVHEASKRAGFSNQEQIDSGCAAAETLLRCYPRGTLDLAASRGLAWPLVIKLQISEADRTEFLEDLRQHVSQPHSTGASTSALLTPSAEPCQRQYGWIVQCGARASVERFRHIKLFQYLYSFFEELEERSGGRVVLCPDKADGNNRKNSALAKLALGVLEAVLLHRDRFKTPRPGYDPHAVVGARLILTVSKHDENACPAVCQARYETIAAAAAHGEELSPHPYTFAPMCSMLMVNSDESNIGFAHGAAPAAVQALNCRALATLDLGFVDIEGLPPMTGKELNRLCKEIAEESGGQCVDYSLRT